VKETGFVSLAKRWWWFLFLGALVSGIVAYAGASRLTPTYEAEANLLTGPINTDFNNQRAAGESSRTYAVLATSRRVMNPTIEKLGLTDTPDELGDRVVATSNEVTRIVTIRVRDNDPARAAQIANSLAANLIAETRKTPPQSIAAINELMRKREVASLPVETQRQIETAATEVLGVPASGILQVVDQADPPTTPVAPQKILLALLAAFAGLLVAGLIVLLREYPGRSLESEEALAELAPVPVLGSVNGSRAIAPGPLEVESGSSNADAYRVLAAKIGFADSERPIRSLLVIGSEAESGSGTLAANLAAVLAETADVTLVDANAPDGEITKVFGLADRPGYGELLAPNGNGQPVSQLDEVLVAQNEGLDVVPHGAVGAQGPFDLSRAQTLLGKLLTSSDFVVVNVPPADRSPSSLVWARAADATVLVVDRRKTTPRSVAGAVQSFSLVGANLIGTVWRDRRRRLVRR
jgi:capsular polysaccharide biosynthesis protein/Mrp family chromosome partitioning ATPase